MRTASPRSLSTSWRSDGSWREEVRAASPESLSSSWRSDGSWREEVWTASPKSLSSNWRSDGSWREEVRTASQRSGSWGPPLRGIKNGLWLFHPPTVWPPDVFPPRIVHLNERPLCPEATVILRHLHASSTPQILH